MKKQNIRVVLGLKIHGHDTGAAIIAHGKTVIAIAEERLNRVKHSPNMFPKLAIDYCLKGAGLSDLDIDMVVIDQVGERRDVPMYDMFVKETGDRFLKAKVHVINHHDAHAASAFFASPYDEAAILVCDGAGEQFDTHLGVRATESDTLYKAKGNEIVELRKICHVRLPNKEYPFTFGAGKLYSLFCEKYLGLGKYNEGKMMGLAPYGNDSVLQEYPIEQWCGEVNGDTMCNSRIAFPSKPVSDRWKSVFMMSRLRPYLRQKVKSIVRSVVSRIPYASEKKNVVHVFPTLRIARPPRSQADTLPDEYFSSVAYVAQKVLEVVTVSLAKKVRMMTGSTNLAVAGGVGLNIDANKKYLDEAGFDNLFVQPAASDTGIPLGCALYGYHVIAGMPRFWSMKSASLGLPYSDTDIADALALRKDELVVKKLGKDKMDAVAKLIADGSIIGWFSGGSEYGPRALGNRSIVCDARRPDMRDTLNARVKHREMWRPFAASVLADHVTDYFDLHVDSPFMLVAAPVHSKKQKEIPSVTHVDGTCRIQSVTHEANPAYRELIEAFYRLTGCPLILNTSFNLGGDPIVETPHDAIDSFLRTNMDYLVLENYLVSKKTT
jgi:carbamoyltransferase